MLGLIGTQDFLDSGLSKSGNVQEREVLDLWETIKNEELKQNAEKMLITEVRFFSKYQNSKFKYYL